MTNPIHKLIIIGGGPAGYTAAIYAARAEYVPIVFTGPEPGGQLTTTTEVENFPGFPKGIMGPDMMPLFREQAERFGTTVIDSNVEKVDFSKRPFTIHAGGKTYHAESVIIATGAAARWLGLESETRLRGKGVSACATCDGYFFRGKEVVVIGGGDAAMEEANVLTKFATKVTIVHRREEFVASKIMLERAQKNPKIIFMVNQETLEILGDKTVSGIRLKDTKTGGTQDVFCQGVFVAIGHVPNTKLFLGQIELDQKGYVVVHGGSKTSVDGVFVAGDVHDHHYRQAITAAGYGCMAAIDAGKWLASQE